MNLMQALGTLAELPAGYAVTITATSDGYAVGLYYENGFALQELDYGMTQEADNVHAVIERIVAARDTALRRDDPDRYALAEAEADEMLHRLNDR